MHLGDLATLGFEFGAPVEGEFLGGFAGLSGSFGGDPLAQRLGTDNELSGGFGDGASDIDDQAGGFMLVLGADGTPGVAARGVFPVMVTSSRVGRGPLIRVSTQRGLGQLVLFQG